MTTTTRITNDTPPKPSVSAPLPSGEGFGGGERHSALSPTYRLALHPTPTPPHRGEGDAAALGGAVANGPTTTVYCLTCGLQMTPHGRPTSAQALDQTRDAFAAACRGDPMAEYDNAPGLRCQIRTGR